jgi:hypothetical protein
MRLKIWLTVFSLLLFALIGSIIPATCSAGLPTLANAVDNPTLLDGSTPLTFTTGTAPWTVVSTQTSTLGDGMAVQSAAIAAEQFSTLQTTFTGTGSVAFYQKISSEKTNDNLSFSIDGRSKSKISGIVSWQQKFFKITTNALHTLTWTYSKNATIDSGADAAWVDKVAISPYTKVAVVYPNGGEVLQAGSTANITWNAPANAEKYTLLYAPDGRTWTTIVSELTDTRFSNITYAWTVPAPATGNVTAKCKIKVIAYNSSNVAVSNSMSKKGFSIEVLRVTSPGDGEIINPKLGPYGIHYTIYGRDDAASATFSFSTTGGSSWISSATVTAPLSAGGHSYDWTVPFQTVLQSKCRVKVDIRNNAGLLLASDMNNVNFSILPTYGISGTVKLNGAPVAGATMALGGQETATTATDGAGNYTFTHLLPGAYTITPNTLGYAFTPQSGNVTIAASNVSAVNFIAAALAGPDTVTASAVTANRINVGWASVNGATGYNVYRSTAPGVAITPGNKVNVSPVDTLAYADKGLKPVTGYYYRVTAIHTADESFGSLEEATTTTPAIIGGTIQGVPLVLTDPAVVTTIAGVSSTTTGTANGIGAAAGFNNPGGMTTDGVNLYVADAGNNAIRKIVIATGEVSTFAGLASGATGTIDGIGTAAGFSWPYGITSDGTNLYVVDSGNYTIRKIVIATGEVSTFAGTAGAIDIVNGVGTEAKFYYPSTITNDGDFLYVTENPTDQLRRIELVSRTVTTLETTPAIGRYFNSLTSDGTYLYAASSISGGNGGTVCRIDPASGVVTDIAGNPALPAGAVDGFGDQATFYLPSGITTDGTNLYVTDINNGTVRKVVIATGQVITLSSGWGIWNWPRGITSDGSSLYAAVQSYNCINRIE